MNVSLTPQLAGFVKDAVSRGMYNNASELMREALRRLKYGPIASAPILARILGRQPSGLPTPLRKLSVASLQTTMRRGLGPSVSA